MKLLLTTPLVLLCFLCAVVQAQDFNSKLGGIGVEIEPTDNGILIKRILPNTPASLVDLRAGDLIIKIDGRQASALNAKEAVIVLRGKVGSVVQLSISRLGQDQEINVKVKRDIIYISRQVYY
ncbi:MAG: PDZ domain-containing protein [Candidatus Tritonobacter lacicola]|nr:PDZ domain-containing protein [Candidatus Tritonobacter lacicola]